MYLHFADDTSLDGNLDLTSANTTCATWADPANGTLVDKSDCTFGYPSNLDFNGNDSFVHLIAGNQSSNQDETIRSNGKYTVISDGVF